VIWHIPHDSLHSEPFLFPILLINAIWQSRDLLNLLIK
jgi:hypothetical protein